MPINFFNEYREVWKGRGNRYVPEVSMEDFVKFCLSLLPHITKRNFRLPKQWYPLPGIFSLNQKRGCKMGGLTQIHLDLDGQHLYVLVRGVGFSRNIGYILVVGLRTYTYHEVRGTGMNYLPLIPLSLQTSYCALLLHVMHHGSFTLELATGETFWDILQDGK